MANALIPDYLGQQVISGIRSLNRNQDNCIVLGKPLGRLQKLLLSNAIREYISVPSRLETAEQIIEEIIKTCQSRPIDYLMPFGIASYYCISKYQDKLNSVVPSMVPHFSQFQLANDKLKTAEFCKEIGVEVPAVYAQYSPSDLSALSKEVRFPVVVKARSGSGVSGRVFYAHNEDELKQFHDAICQNQVPKPGFDPLPPLIQEYIPGFIHDACCLSSHGKVITVFTQKRQVMYPLSGGVGAVNISTHDPVLTDISHQLLESLEWHGPAQIEFKYDERDKRYKLIEINPKLWGTLDLAIKCGINFPVLIRNNLLGVKNPATFSYPKNVVYKFRFPQYWMAKRNVRHEVKNLIKQLDLSNCKTHSDFDRLDPKPDILRMLGTFSK